MTKKIFFWLLLVTLINLVSSDLFSFEYQQLIYSTTKKSFINFDSMINDLNNYDVVYLGEQHDDLTHHQSQKNIMEAVSANVGPVAVGLEFIKWTEQELLNNYVHGQISQTEFLKMIDWGDNNFSFDFYAPLISVAHQSGGHVFGINAPQWLTKKIANLGINSLTSYEFTFMPMHFQLGSELYFKMFKAAMEEMNHPIPPAFLNNLFEVQSVWDETMSFYAVLNLKHSFTPFFIIVGNFHIAYKLGSPASIRSRLLPSQTLATVYHVNAKGMTEVMIQSMIKKHAIYGDLADYIVFIY
ncbi:MAG: hypothetical protein A2381_04385 [Bdellovibrionales bacterium RIFOXYB1_FULL_37_110]|nr:MAG: hypothetical protein A2417_15965 [Bdellovibrionales bacterium RIFOXYC1_FULL_37_79]OFZ57405.1 MAG: hypothetical protein A2381_04385 [Bdellovibrionales bacterium RIFOXYB1_FULL_37_110]OFZ62257.1 MAG: hypothetical protein A2577_12905 [Bdellovibrionales bacterium RIFOXYD1_FULL_36_51]